MGQSCPLVPPNPFWPALHHQERKAKHKEATFSRPPKPFAVPVLNPFHSPVSHCCLPRDLFCHSIPAIQPVSQLLQIGKERCREVPGLVLSPRKPGHPSQRAAGISPKASLPCHAPAWGNNASVEGVCTVCTVPHFTEEGAGLQRGTATCLRSHSQEMAKLRFRACDSRGGN